MRWISSDPLNRFRFPVDDHEEGRLQSRGTQNRYGVAR